MSHHMEKMNTSPISGLDVLRKDLLASGTPYSVNELLYKIKDGTGWTIYGDKSDFFHPDEHVYVIFGALDIRKLKEMIKRHRDEDIVEPYVNHLSNDYGSNVVGSEANRAQLKNGKIHCVKIDEVEDISEDTDINYFSDILIETRVNDLPVSINLYKDLVFKKEGLIEFLLDSMIKRKVPKRYGEVAEVIGNTRGLPANMVGNIKSMLGTNNGTRKSRRRFRQRKNNNQSNKNRTQKKRSPNK